MQFLKVYTIFGTSKQCAIGPTAISSALMVDFILRPANWPADPQFHGTSSPYLATLLGFTMGTILTMLGLLQLGFLVNFISPSVVSGFIQAAAFTIPLGQLKKIFGLKVEATTFARKIYEILIGIFDGDTNWYDFLIGSISILLLITLKMIKTKSQNYDFLRDSKVVWFFWPVLL